MYLHRFYQMNGKYLLLFSRNDKEVFPLISINLHWRCFVLRNINPIFFLVIVLLWCSLYPLIYVMSDNICPKWYLLVRKINPISNPIHITALHLIYPVFLYSGLSVFTWPVPAIIRVSLQCHKFGLLPQPFPQKSCST